MFELLTSLKRRFTIEQSLANTDGGPYHNGKVTAYRDCIADVEKQIKAGLEIYELDGDLYFSLDTAIRELSRREQSYNNKERFNAMLSTDGRELWVEKNGEDYKTLEIKTKKVK